MSINLQETLKNVFNMDSFDYEDAISLSSLDLVYDNIILENGEELSFEKFYQTFEKMVKEEGVYLELLPNDGVFIKMKSGYYKIYQEITNGDKIETKGPVIVDSQDFPSFMNLFADEIEGHYGVAFTYENGEINAKYCYIGPSNPSGHCGLAFIELGETPEEKKLIELLDYSIVYEK